MTGELEIPGIGTFAVDDDLGWLVGRDRFEVPALGLSGVFVLDDPDADPAVVSPAMRSFLALDRTALAQVTPHVWAYYRDCVATGWAPDVVIARPDDVWQHVRMPEHVTVFVDHGVAYVDLECGCDWEIEHGLNLVFRDGDRISKVGQYDGHLHHLDPAEVYPGV